MMGESHAPSPPIVSRRYPTPMFRFAATPRCFLMVCCALLPPLSAAPLTRAENPAASKAGKPTWTRNGFAEPRYRISGTGTRNNPLRRPLQPARDGDELFVRFRLRYQAESIDLPEQGDGEFFVLWLDSSEGGDGSPHAANVPNVGLHVDGDQNRFMIRFRSSGQAFGPVLKGDTDYLVVARLWKSGAGSEQSFDQLDLWVDPADDAEFSPAASTRSRDSLNAVRWIGFSTGAKTEFDDVIEVWDIAVDDSWRRILKLPESVGEAPDRPNRPIEKTVSFGEDVHPILRDRCFGCHSGEDPDSELRLDVLDEVLNQTTPFRADESRLLRVVADGEMPPDGGPLPKDEQATLAAWINEGLDWDEQRLPTPIPQTEHRFFQPIERPEIPTVQRSDWLRTPVDAFIAARQEAIGVPPNPPADPQTLARRMSLDVLGLPPGDATIDADDVRGRTAIDKVLSHPGYGIRWGRHWLDLARWAESNGHQHNRDRPHAWRYRDWVVDAFNANLPYDQFIKQQLAGDLIRPLDRRHVIATGFLAAARYSGNELDKDIQRNDILVDITNVTASAVMGVTLQCAQCHTHKFDPLTIRDYYRFQTFFANGQPHNVALNHDQNDVRQTVQQRWDLFDAVHERLVTIKRKQGHPEPIYVIPKAVINGMKADERKRFQQLEQQIKTAEQSWAFLQPEPNDLGWMVTPHEMRWPLRHDPEALAKRRNHLLLRGDVHSRGPAVRAGWPAVFGAPPADRSVDRLDLADWLTDRQHPLTARVWVNRIWQWHFGRGLVETSSDFGTQGTPPTHPKLLDYLACELIDSGWDTAHIHRLILDSATYRQSHRFDAERARIDPTNRTWWRWQPRRLEAEAIRDCMLAAGGGLDQTQGGPSDDAETLRRGLYLRQKRDALDPQQILFDGSVGIASCARRRVSTNGLQPLWLLNDPFSQRAAEGLAERGGDVAGVLRRALGRPPHDDELETLEDLADRHGLASASLAILNSSEFLYIP